MSCPCTHSLAPGYVLGYNAQPDLTFESAKRVSTYGTAAQLLDRDANSQPLHAGVSRAISSSWFGV